MHHTRFVPIELHEDQIPQAQSSARNHRKDRKLRWGSARGVHSRK